MFFIEFEILYDIFSIYYNFTPISISEIFISMSHQHNFIEV